MQEVKHIQKSLLSNTVWNTLGIIIYTACQWMITIIVVWLYEDFANAGNLALAMSITNFFYCIAAYNMRVYQVSDVNNEYSDSVYIVSRLVTCISAIIVCVVFVIIARYPSEQVLIIICYMGFRSVEAFIDVFHGIVHKHRRLDYAGISMITRGIIILITFSILGSFFTLLQAVIGITVMTALFALFYDWTRAKQFIVLTRCSIKQVFSLLKRCLPLMPVVLMFTFYTAYTRYVLELVHGTEALGAYTSATAPAIALQLAVSFIFAPLANIFNDCIKKQDNKKMNKIVLVTCVLILGVTITAAAITYVAGQWGLNLIFGEKILPYTYLLPGAVIVAGLTAAMGFFNLVFSSVRDITGIFSACFAGVVICIVTTEIIIRAQGLNGANYAMITCQGVAVLILCIRYVFKQNKTPSTGG